MRGLDEKFLMGDPYMLDPYMLYIHLRGRK